LAAGLARRAGWRKMELPFGEQPLLLCAVASMAEVVSRVIVVVGHEGERLAALLAGHSGVVVVHNPRYEEGMFSSIQVGIAEVRAARFFLLPGDHPLISAAVYRQMLAAPGEIIIPTYQGHKGHPVLLASALIPALLALPALANLRDFIAARGFVPLPVAEEGVTLDVDTLDDYNRLRKKSAG
jgi:molybdenum cofactor cytidylyltransferase